MTVASKTRIHRDPLVRKMSVICLIGFGGFIVWAGFAPLEEGVSAAGKIIVENDRQQVQHFEGGIIDQLLVREGSLVEVGDTLVVLKSTASRSNRNQVIQQYAAKSATIARLEALKENKPQLSLSGLDDLQLDPTQLASIIKRETTSFEQEGIMLSSDIAVLRARINTAQQLQRSRTDEIEIGTRALSSARSERNVIAAMVEEQLARRDRLTEVNRLVASIEGDISRLEGERADAIANERDLRAQIGQTRARAAQRWANEILLASADLQAAREQLEAAQDVVERSVITAPVSGEVLNLKASTIGGVIRPGDTLMEIVPALFDVTASVQIMPADRPTVYEGLLVR
ncbi:HlyD family type I secretion periplasmic adaptor subunit, partial [Algimonas arctica]|uniref:HlyD family type I secretion periplasmic adaptor subunit n=1 Tax=Algimonas arctica TaxID=1479486 RepID=UPI0016756187